MTTHAPRAHRLRGGVAACLLTALVATGGGTSSGVAAAAPEVATRASHDVTALGQAVEVVAATDLAVPGPVRPARAAADGTEAGGGSDPADDGREPAGLRLVSDFVDVCGDGTSLDLRRAGVFLDREGDRAGFDVIGCAGVGADIADVRLTWFVDLDLDGRADRAVLVDGGDGSAVALARPTDGADGTGTGEDPDSDAAPADEDLADWPVVWEDTVALNNDGRGRLRTTVLMPATVLPGDDAFEFVLALSSASLGDVTDRIPEPYEAALRHPTDCSDSAAVVEVAPGARGDVRADLQARGFLVSGSRLLRVQPATPADLAAIAATDGVTAVRSPRTFQLAALPDDPYVDEWALESMRAEEGFGMRPGLPTRIAVVDDGVDARRADLRGRVLAGWDAVNSRPIVAGRSSDRGGHGTSVAGVAAAARDNGLGVAGINPDALILPVRVSDAAGCIDDASLVEALAWAADAGADVVNLSLGGPEESDELAAAVADLAATGVVMVGASGNDPNLDVFYPATYHDVIAVGAVAPGDVVASYSTGGAWIDVVAPGGAAHAGDDGIAVMSEDRTLRRTSGTSFAAPQVSGALSLWIGRSGGRPGVDAARDALALSARDIAEPGRDDTSGFGALDLAALLDRGLALGAELTGFDGDPRTVDHLVQVDGVEAAIGMSRDRFAYRQAGHAVLVGADRSVDAVVAAPLLGDGPLLFAGPEGLPEATRDELMRVTRPGATIYLVGGESGLPTAVEADLADLGRIPVRLAGDGRIGTSLAVADEVVRRHGPPALVLVARAGSSADGSEPWPDAIGAAAWAASTHAPVLLSDGATLSPRVASWLADRPQAERVVLGGPGVLSDEVVAELGETGTVRRVSGTDRAGTARAVARELFRSPTSGWRWFLVTNGRDAAGWVPGMLAAGLAADLRAPLLLVEQASVPSATAELVAGCADRPVELLVVDATVPDSLVGELSVLATSGC